MRPRYLVLTVLFLVFALEGMLRFSYRKFDGFEVITPQPQTDRHRPEILSNITNLPFDSDETRILITGGSTAYGWGATSRERTIGAYLESNLNTCYPNRKIKVVNAGVPSFLAVDELTLYIEYLYKFRPEIIIMFTGYNDLFETARKGLLKNPEYRLTRLERYGVLDATQSLKLLQAWLASVALHVRSFLSRHSFIFLWIEDGIKKRNYTPIANFSNYSDPYAEQAVESFHNAVKAFRFLAKENNSQFMVVYQPVETLSPRKQTQGRYSKFEKKLCLIYKHNMKKNLERLSTETNFPFFDFNDTLIDSMIDQDMLIDHCHLNDQGNQMAAGVLSDIIQQKRYLDPN